MSEILRRCEMSAWDFRADHELLGFRRSSLFARLAIVSILLLVHAMKLDEGSVGSRYPTRGLLEVVSERSPQKLALIFDRFHVCHEVPSLISIKPIDIIELRW